VKKKHLKNIQRQFKEELTQIRTAYNTLNEASQVKQEEIDHLVLERDKLTEELQQKGVQEVKSM